MPKPRADDYEDQAPACIPGQHENCPHLKGYGSMPSLRRLRFAAGALLCECGCHSSCPLTGKRKTVLEQTWRESYTGPGAEDERPRREPAAVQAWRPPPPLHEVVDAVRARAADKSPEQIKDLCRTELLARGLDIQLVLSRRAGVRQGNTATGAHSCHVARPRHPRCPANASAEPSVPTVRDEEATNLGHLLGSRHRLKFCYEPRAPGTHLVIPGKSFPVGGQAPFQSFRYGASQITLAHIDWRFRINHLSIALR